MKDLTKFLNETFGAPIEKGQAAVVNATVDPMAAETDPNDERFSPQNKNELGVAIDKVVKELPDDFVRPFYKEIKKTITNFEKGGGQNMSNADNKKKKTEEAIRRVVRSMLAETMVIKEAPKDDDDDDYIANLLKAADEEGEGGDAPEIDGSDTAGAERAKFLAKRKAGLKAAASAQPNPKHLQRRGAMNAWARDRLSSETDADRAARAGRATAGYDANDLMKYDELGARLPELGFEKGMASSGAKALVYRLVDMLQFGKDYLGDEEFENAVRVAVTDYIDELEDLGSLPGDDPNDEITAADITLLRKHPLMVAELESFPLFLKRELEERGYADAFSKLGKQQRAADAAWYASREEHEGITAPTGVGDANFPDDRPLDPRSAPTKKKRK